MSHVCRQWRELALQTPTLWTTLEFPERCLWQKNQEWLIRSKQSPLNIFIYRSSYDPDIRSSDVAMKEVQADLGFILDLIIQHVARWAVFELRVYLYEHMVFALKRLEQCPAYPGAPLLRILALLVQEGHDDSRSEDVDSSERTKLSLPFGGHAPRLDVVVLW
ncbi:hypothetical protein ACEPAI_9160 [Sanghuangporus weigelae]